MGVQILTREGAISRAKMGPPGHARTCPEVDILKAARRGRQNRYDADADLGVLDGGHIGVTWRIRLNCPCAAAMRPYVKLS